MAETIQRGKIKKAPAAEIVQYLIRPAIEADLKRSYNTILDINKAHILMLAKTGIIRKEVAKQLLQATAQIESEKDHPTFDINPNVEDLYFNLERYLIKLTGLEVGGQQHTARSRNDLFATEIRIDTRKSYLKLAQLFIELRRTYLDLARRNLETVMSGYTHMQPSEPITFAHYLSGVSYALARDYERYSHAWKSLNLCPLGGCSMGSTSFPINREMTAKLLGFDAPVQNSLDCVASRDYLLEILMALSATAVTMSRTALDFYNWSTPQYGYIEVDDSCAVCSSIMPQKKNPFTFEHVKAKAAHIEGFMMSVLNAMKNVIFSHCRDTSVERMYEDAAQNFCTVTELANYLVRHDGISFREAHEIIAHTVGNMCDRHLTCANIDRATVNEAAKALYGFETKLSDELIREALDPKRVAFEKTCIGGTAPSEVSRQLDLIEAQIETDEKVLADRQAQLKTADSLLAKSVAEAVA